MLTTLISRMRSFALPTIIPALGLLVVGCGEPEAEIETQEDNLFGLHLGQNQVWNLHGIAESYSPLGSIAELRQTNAFFKDMGTTGRTCESCHSAEGGWTASASDRLWFSSHGNDPLFLFTHDVGVCPESDVSRRRNRLRAHRLTIGRGSARGGGSVAASDEFEVVSVDDPYNCADTSLTSFFGYRKPNPISSMSQKSAATWAPAAQAPDMRALLQGFMVGATQFHGLTSYVPTQEEQEEGADFMLNLYFAQIEDVIAGRLDDDGAQGGPVHLAAQPWFPGINHSSTGPTTRRVFTIYDEWLDIDPNVGRWWERIRLARRLQIAQGQEIFNTRQNANGGTCSGCHNSPNVGSSSVFRLFDIGTVDILDPELPRVRVRNKATGEERVVNNLGLADSTGLWSDIGRMKVPILRGLAQRGPYFNSGQARTLQDVVDHYDQRFNFDFTAEERAALVAFLGAL